MNQIQKLVVLSLFSVSTIALLGSVLLGQSAAGSAAGNAAPSTAGDFIRGATVWANNCTRCHNLRNPNEFNDREWQVIGTHMRVRAGLTGQEARDVIAFLQQSN